jgi:hypothetical protein
MYTRMSLQHLDMETLYVYGLDFERDPVGPPLLLRACYTYLREMLTSSPRLIRAIF